MKVFFSRFDERIHARARNLVAYVARFFGVCVSSQLIKALALGFYHIKNVAKKRDIFFQNLAKRLCSGFSFLSVCAVKFA